MDARAILQQMPIKPEEAFEVVGFNPADYEDVESFREAMEKKFVARENAHKDKDVTSKVLGAVNAIVRRKVSGVAKELGIEVPEEHEAVKMLDHLEPALKGLKTQADEWKAKAEKGVGEDILNEHKKKLADLEKERNAFQSQAKEFADKYESLFGEVNTSRKKAVLDSEWNKAIGGVQFSSSVDELRKEGFLSKVRGKYRVELDEELKPRLVDADKGEPIKHPRKAGELLTLEEALKIEAKELKLVSENPHGDKPVKGGAGERKTLEQQLSERRAAAGGEGPKGRQARPAFGSWAK